VNVSDLRTVLAAHAKWLRNEGTGQRANLRDADLRDADLGAADLGAADLGGADLRGANLRDADLGAADLGAADLGGADLRGANLRDADLRGADLGGANLRGADLRDADLRDADLRDANGLKWAGFGPVGQTPTFLQGWWDGHRVVIAGGCFLGSVGEFRDVIDGAAPWNWIEGTNADRERWRAECVAAVDWIESSIDRQVSSCGR
jgi:hypothetical protein